MSVVVVVGGVDRDDPSPHAADLLAEHAETEHRSVRLHKADGEEGVTCHAEDGGRVASRGVSRVRGSPGGPDCTAQEGTELALLLHRVRDRGMGPLLENPRRRQEVRVEGVAARDGSEVRRRVVVGSGDDRDRSTRHELRTRLAGREGGDDADEEHENEHGSEDRRDLLHALQHPIHGKPPG